MSRSVIPHLPCESLVVRVCGDQWRNLPEREMDGAWGVAIIKSAIDGVRLDLYNIATHLGVDSYLLKSAYRRLNMNGVFRFNRLDADRECLQNDDMLAWCYYAGYASGFTGTLGDKW